MKTLINIFIVLSIINCSEQHNSLSHREKTVIDNCIKYLNSNDLKGCYIVSPYFKPFIISNFLDSPDTKFIKTFEDKINYYKNIETLINNNYKNVFNIDLLKFSKCNKSKNIVSFSGVGENIIIAYVIETNQKKSIDDLINKDTINYNYIEFYIFFFDKNGIINKVLRDGVAYD